MPEKLKVRIKTSAREYGYVIWDGDKDDSVRELIGDRNTVRVTFLGDAQGEKNVDWKYHRISLGATQTERLPESASHFVLTFDQNSTTLSISCS
jgi:hypothetical protein